MKKNVVYFGEQTIFSDTIKTMTQMEGANFYDFSTWEDCSGQFYDLSVNYIFIDLDTFDYSAIGKEARSVECIFFHEEGMNDLSWDTVYHSVPKPLDVVSFRDFIKDILNG